MAACTGEFEREHGRKWLSVLGSFSVRTDANGCLYWGILACARTQMHATAHRGCRNTVRESALKVDCGRKSPCRTEESLGLPLTQLSYISMAAY